MIIKETFKNEFEGTGWEKLWQDTYEKLLKAMPSISFSYVKEKYGVMIIRTTGEANDSVKTIINEAKYKSAHTCIECGEESAESIVREDIPWFLALCDVCYKKEEFTKCLQTEKQNTSLNTSRMLTRQEIDSLRQDKKEAGEYAKKYFKELLEKRKQNTNKKK